MHFLRKSIKTRLIFIFIACTIVPFIVQSVVVSSLYNQKLVKKINEESILGLEKLSWEVGLNMQKLLTMASMHTSNEQFKSIISSSLHDPSIAEQACNAITGTIATNLKDGDIHIHVLVISRDGKAYSHLRFGDAVEKSITGRIFQDDWYTQSFKNQSGIMWLGVRDDYGPFGGGRSFCLARHLVSDGEYVGTVLVSMDDYMLYRLFDQAKISADSGIYLTDSQGKMLMGYSSNDRGAGLRDDSTVVSSLKRGVAERDGYRIVSGGGRSSMVSFCAMPDFDWNLVSVTPETSVLKEMNGVRVIPLAMLAVMLAFLILFVLILNKEIFMPVVHLSTGLKEVRQGNLDVTLSLPYDNEIGELGKGFNQMTADLKLSIRQIQEEEEQKRRLEVQALESQIKPHFIYNTLNSIKWMAEMQNARSVADAIVAMASLIEYNVGKQGIVVTVAEEAEALKNYIYLQQLRYWNSFEVFFSIAEDTRALCVPRLSLQPVVENSINHGFAGIPYKGEVRISSALTREGLLFRIEDNGIGIEPLTLEDLLADPPSDEASPRRGVGIHNVNQRIKLRYGQDYGLAITSAPGRGTLVTLLFPIIRECSEGYVQ